MPFSTVSFAVSAPLSQFIVPVLALITGVLLVRAAFCALSRRGVGRRVEALADWPAEIAAPRPGQGRLYYCFAPNCGPCRAMTQLIDRLQAEHPALIRVDVSCYPQIARYFGVMATPSFVWVQDGVVREVKVGAQRPAALAAWLARVEGR